VRRVAKIILLGGWLVAMIFLALASVAYGWTLSL
jgi:hypothetical protein